MDKAEALRRIETEEDFIRYPKLDNSLEALLAENFYRPLDDATIARVLVMTEEEVEKVYQEALEKLRKAMKV